MLFPFFYGSLLYTNTKLGNTIIKHIIYNENDDVRDEYIQVISNIFLRVLIPNVLTTDNQTNEFETQPSEVLYSDINLQLPPGNICLLDIPTVDEQSNIEIMKLLILHDIQSRAGIR